MSAAKKQKPDGVHDGAQNGPHAGARFAYDGLDRLFHERARLSILSSLAAHGAGLVFNDLKRLCALTDGNLSRQLQQLAEAGVVEVWKRQNKNRPQTLVRLTHAGRARFSEYLAVLGEVISDAAKADATSQKTTRSPSAGFAG
jgi:DNA-binding HxlR family transcriptional regulator